LYSQHLDFHSLILNNSAGYNGILFPFSSEPTAATPAHLIPAVDGTLPDPISPSGGLLTADQLKEDQPATIPDSELEGFDRDPTLLKVVDRRWYEKNKHIYPMSVWEDFDPAKDYSDGGKKDREGNAFFFSSR
jgi:protein FAM50